MYKVEQDKEQLLEDFFQFFFPNGQKNQQGLKQSSKQNTGSPGAPGSAPKRRMKPQKRFSQSIPKDETPLEEKQEKA